MPHSIKTRYPWIIFLLVCLIPNPTFAADVAFSQFTSAGQASSLHADLNNDGREDFVYQNFNGIGFSVQLSSGDGIYAPAVSYALPNGDRAGAIGIGDFNSDKLADLVVIGNASTGANETLYLYLNNGNGTFTQKASFAIASDATAVFDIAVGDFNHDGIMDVAFEQYPHLIVWFGDGRSGFNPGPSTPIHLYGNLMLGDFDGDGYADLAIGDFNNYDTVEVLFGDGTGYFPVQSTINTPQYSIFGATDVNSDGKMDIVASTYYPNAPKHIDVYYGDANRNWDNNTTIPMSHCASDLMAPLAADMNGDGINDLVLPETECGENNSGYGYDYVGVLTRNANSSYNPDQIVYTSPAHPVYPKPPLYTIGPYAIRGNLDTKPDIALTQCTTSPCNAAADNKIHVLLNTTTGHFPTCSPPNAFEGINVCSPGPDSTVTSPVSFRVGAAGQVVMRKVEVWVDGEKLVEDLNGFSHYTFLDRSLDLMSGKHRVDIYAAGWDNSLQEKSFDLTVK